MAIQKEEHDEEVPHVVPVHCRDDGQVNNNKRRHRSPPHEHLEDDGDHQQQAGCAAADHADVVDDGDHPPPPPPRHHHHRKKKPRQLPVPWETTSASLPRFLREYNTEDAERFNEDLARTDKLLDDVAARVAAGLTPDFPHDPMARCVEERRREREREWQAAAAAGGVGVPAVRGRVTNATINVLRGFAATSGYDPMSERLLCNPCLYTQAAADEVRKRDRLISKLYAWAQARTTDILRHYDAKGYLEYSLDGTINTSD